MKKIILVIFFTLGLTTINSCKKNKEQPVPNNQEPVTNKIVTAEKTNVKTYEIINLIAHENLANKYSATFGSDTIELIKTSDSTLTFYVPDIAAGEVSLKFDLATIKFNVTKTVEINATQLIKNYTQKFDTQVSLLNLSTPDEIAEVNSLKQYKQEVISLFNSLTNDQKREAVMFYEANKEIFQSFANSTFSNLNASTTMKLQSDCPRTDFKSFYGCTAENLGNAAVGLKNASKEFVEMLVLAGVSAYLAPASFGLTAFGTSLALGTAGYLLITELSPAALHFKNSLYPFLNANWVFSKALFQTTNEVFQDQINTSLNLTPKFRSLTLNDGNINSGIGYFISTMTSLSEYWNKLNAIFGNLPTYKNTEESTTLATNEVSISNISNSNVQYQSNTGQSVKFKSLSGNEENFTYKISVSKEGFVEEKTLTGKVLAVTALSISTAIPGSITSNSAVLGGIITNDGGKAILDKGVTYSPNSNLVPSTTVSAGTGNNTFLNTVTGLTENKTYYVRAYATNSEGTAYGNVLKFTTVINNLNLLNNTYWVGYYTCPSWGTGSYPSGSFPDYPNTPAEHRPITIRFSYSTDSTIYGNVTYPNVQLGGSTGGYLQGYVNLSGTVITWSTGSFDFFWNYPAKWSVSGNVMTGIFDSKSGCQGVSHIIYKE